MLGYYLDTSGDIHIDFWRVVFWSGAGDNRRYGYESHRLSLILFILANPMKAFAGILIWGSATLAEICGVWFGRKLTRPGSFGLKSPEARLPLPGGSNEKNGLDYPFPQTSGQWLLYWTTPSKQNWPFQADRPNATTISSSAIPWLVSRCCPSRCRPWRRHLCCWLKGSWKHWRLPWISLWSFYNFRDDLLCWLLWSESVPWTVSSSTE